MDDFISREEALDVVKCTSGDYAAAFAEIAHMPAADVVSSAQYKQLEENFNDLMKLVFWDGSSAELKTCGNCSAKECRYRLADGRGPRINCPLWENSVCAER